MEEEIKSLSSKTIDILKYVYPIYIIILILLDYIVFTDYLGFNIPLLKEIYYDIELLSLNIVVFLFLIPWILFTIIIFISIFSIKLFNKISINQENIYYYGVMLFLFYLINVYCSYLVFDNYQKIAGLYLSLLLFIEIFIVSFYFIICKKIFEVYLSDTSNIKNKILILFLSVECIIFFKMNVVFSTLLILVSYFYILSYGNNKNINKNVHFLQNYPINNLRGSRNKDKKSLVALLLFSIFFFALFFFYDLNKESWKKEIDVSHSSIFQMTANLIFNKELIQKNNADIFIEIDKNYYPQLTKQFLLEKDISEENNCKKENNSKKENNCLKIDKNYFYMIVSPTLKIYFKNLTIGDRFIGYRTLMLEEKKYGNSPGSEHSLLGYKNNIFTSEFGYKKNIFTSNEEIIKALEKELKLKMKDFKIEKVEEDKDMYSINQCIKSKEGIDLVSIFNKYHITYKIDDKKKKIFLSLDWYKSFKIN